MAEVVLDTDVLIDHLRGTRTLGVEFRGSVYSSITGAELYGGADEGVVDRLLDQFDEIPVDRRIAEEAGRIRRTTGLRAAGRLDRGDGGGEQAAALLPKPPRLQEGPAAHPPPALTPRFLRGPGPKTRFPSHPSYIGGG